MGLITSYYWENTGRTDDPDPATGLTSRQKYIIRTTWKKLTEAQNNLQTGMTIFLKQEIFQNLHYDIKLT